MLRIYRMTETDCERVARENLERDEQAKKRAAQRKLLDAKMNATLAGASDTIGHLRDYHNRFDRVLDQLNKVAAEQITQTVGQFAQECSNMLTENREMNDN